MERLQKLAERQGHPAAAVTQLRSLGFEATPDMEAAAMGITPEDVKAAARRGGSIESRLEALLKRPLTPQQKRLIADADRDLVQSLEGPRKDYVQDLARATGLSVQQVGKIALPTGRQDPAVDKTALTKIESLVGRRLMARELDQIRAADQRNQAAARSQQEAYARQLAKITGIPHKYVLELLRLTSTDRLPKS
jgi:uncharacterized protein YdbL (DUF1318 family)